MADMERERKGVKRINVGNMEGKKNMGGGKEGELWGKGRERERKR